MESKFSLTTAQAAHRLGVKQHVLIKHFNLHGNYKGIVPRKQPNGRWLCPRDQVLKTASFRPDGSASTVPANAAVSFFEEKNLDCSDPILQEALIHLHATEADSSHGAAHLFTEAAMVGSLIAAFVARLNSAESGMTKRDFERCCEELAWRFESHAYLFGFLKAGAVEGK